MRNAAADPATRATREVLAATKSLLAQRRKAVRPIVIRRLREHTAEERIAQGEDRDQDLAMLSDLEERINDEIKSIVDGSQSIAKSTLDLRDKQDEVAQMHAAATKVGDAVEALSVELEAPSRIRSIEDAVVPRIRDQKKRYMMIGLSVLGSFVGGLFGIAFLELLSQKVDSTEQVPADLGLHIVGTLPIVRSRPARGEWVGTRRVEKDRYYQNLMLESIDATRTILVHAARTASHRVVMIASAVASEGKTSLASHLATSLARSGLRTLLVDADLRCPSIHRLFDMPLAAGISEVLRDEVNLAEAIQATPIEELKILTAGHCDRQTIRVLSLGGLSPLFATLKEEFDFIIVDSSPILPVADALLVAQQVDAVLFSIFRDVSRKAKVSAASHRLHSLGVPILGAVVTGDHGGLYGSEYESSPYHLLPDSASRRSSGTADHEPRGSDSSSPLRPNLEASRSTDHHDYEHQNAY